MTRTINTVEELAPIEEYLNGEKVDVIKLASPVANINEWYGHEKLYASYIAVPGRDSINDVQDTIEGLLYFRFLIVNDPGKTAARTGDVLPIEKWDEICAVGGSALCGVDAVGQLVESSRDKGNYYYQEYGRIRSKYEKELFEINEMRAGGNSLTPEQVEKNYIRIAEIKHEMNPYLRKINAEEYISKTYPSRFLIEKIELFNENIRRYLTSSPGYKELLRDYDILSALCHIIRSNERLKRLETLNAPMQIIFREKRLLQQRVDSLINGEKDIDHRERYDTEYDRETSGMHASLSSLVNHSIKLI